MAQIIELFPEIVSSGPSDETILLPDETISRFSADIRKQRMVIKPTTSRRATPAPKPETVKCGPSASSWPSPSCWPPRWPVCRTLACRASAPSHTTGLPLPLQHLKLSWLRPINSQLEPKKLAGKAIMFFRISAAAIVACFLIGGSAQAQAHQIQFCSLTKLPDPRG